MLSQGGIECLGRGEEAFLEQFDYKLGGVELAGITGLLDARLAILLQELVDIALLLGICNGDGIDGTLWEARRAIPFLRQFRFQAAYHDRVQLFVLWLHASSETLVVQQFQQSGAALAIAVVRRVMEE